MGNHYQTTRHEVGTRTNPESSVHNGIIIVTAIHGDMCATERIRVSPEVKAALDTAQLPDESYSETIERLIEEREVVEEYLDVF